MKGNREPIKTKKQEIINYWIKEMGDDLKGVDWADAHERCWRCGSIKRLERAHIVPYSLGGKDEPSNFVLLCPRCHKEGPNVSDPEIMWDWINAYSQPLYETYWVMQGVDEYEKLYNRKFSDDYKDIIVMAGIKKKDYERTSKLFYGLIEENLKNVTIHYGQPYLNKASIAGLIRTSLKNLSKIFGVQMINERDKVHDGIFLEWAFADGIGKILKREHKKNNSPIFRA